MSEKDITIAAAAPADLDEVLSLLSAVGLPLEGVAENLENFLVVKDEGGQIIACAGLERYGEFALLRSVAVSNDLQGSGIGSCLTAQIIKHGKETGIKEILLLTTTARDFFARCFDFSEVARNSYDAQFSESPEWNLPRCSSAVVMKLSL